MSIADNLRALLTRIETAARKAGRDPAGVRLMAVTKNVEEARIREALEAGQRLFGENYVQEAAGKWPALREAYPDIELHLIGALQTNKTEDALALFDVIETLDRPKLAESLAKEIQKLGRHPALFLEVNMAHEPQKHGVTPEALPALLNQACALGLKVKGLMTIPPAESDSTPYFQGLAALGAHHHLSELSMGMSGDFETAIACGSTLVRVGTALFGERKK